MSVTVSLLPLQCCLHVGHSFVVAVVVLPSSSHHHSFIVIAVLPSSSHCHGVIVTVSLSPLWCHLRHYIVAVSSSQLHRYGAFAIASLWFRRHYCGVAFIVALSQCLSPFHHRHRSVASVIASSWCRHRGFVIAVAVSLLWFCCHRCGVAFAVASSSPHSVIVAVTSLCCRGCGCGHGHIVVMVIMVVVVVTLWLLPSLLHHHGHCCIVVVVVVEVIVASWLWAHRSCHGCHCVIAVALLLLLLLSLLHQSGRGHGRSCIVAVSS